MKLGLAVAGFLVVLVCGEDRNVPQWFKDDIQEQLPRASADSDGRISFDIPYDVAASYLAVNPADYLKGACLQSYQGYKDGKRLDSIMYSLGEETRDFVVEFVLFDFLTNDCQWVSHYWGDLINGWEYVVKKDSAVLKQIGKDFGFLSAQMQSWFGWWISQNPNLYSDTVLVWKTQVALQFLSLKKKNSFVSDLPTLLKGSKKHFKSDSDACNNINPVLFFEPVWMPIAKQLNLWRRKDVGSGKKSNKKSRGGRRSNQNMGDPGTEHKTILRVNIPVVVCGGACIQVGTGFTWDFKEEEPQVHWTYAIGDHISVTDLSYDTAARVKVQMQVWCKKIEDISSTYGGHFEYGQLLNAREQNVEYHVLFSKNPDSELHGISFSKPFEGKFDTEYGYSFAYVNSGPIARVGAPTDEEEPLTNAKPPPDPSTTSAKTHSRKTTTTTTEAPPTTTEAPPTTTTTKAPPTTTEAAPVRSTSKVVEEEDTVTTDSPAVSTTKEATEAPVTTSAPDTSEGIDLPIETYPSGVGCNATYVYTDEHTSTCFLDIHKLNDNHWGWAVEIQDGQALTGDIIAGALGCDLDAGTTMGTFSMSLHGCVLYLDYNMYPSVTYFKRLQVQYGSEPYARNKKNNITVDPELYTHMYNSFISPQESFNMVYEDACHRGLSTKNGAEVLYVMVHGIGCFYEELFDTESSMSPGNAEAMAVDVSHRSPQVSMRGSSTYISRIILAIVVFATCAMLFQLRNSFAKKGLMSGETVPLLGNRKDPVVITCFQGEDEYNLLP